MNSNFSPTRSSLSRQKIVFMGRSSQRVDSRLSRFAALSLFQKYPTSTRNAVENTKKIISITMKRPSCAPILKCSFLLSNELNILKSKSQDSLQDYYFN